MNEVHVVLSYDLGLKGDYNGLYIWLDKKGAIECGSNLAALALHVEYTDFENVYNVLKLEIASSFKIEVTDRLYMIMKDSTDNMMKGRFLFGLRRRAPWEGYYLNEPNSADIF
jgi:hypothetical protein